MGSPSNLPGVIVAFTPTGGSSDGGCIGEGPCQSSPCTYKKGVVTVFNENNPEPVDVSNINGAPRAIVEPGESVPFPVLSDPPSGQFISCGANVGLLVMNTESDGDFYISLRCTSCPEDVNGY